MQNLQTIAAKNGVYTQGTLQHPLGAIVVREWGLTTLQSETEYHATCRKLLRLTTAQSIISELVRRHTNRSTDDSQICHIPNSLFRLMELIDNN